MSEPGEPFRMLTAFDAAMKDEGIDAVTREHVINRLVYGDPEGPRRRVREDAQRQQVIHVHTSGPDVDPAYLQRHMAILQQARDRII